MHDMIVNNDADQMMATIDSQVFMSIANKSADAWYMRCDATDEMKLLRRYVVPDREALQSRIIGILKGAEPCADHIHEMQERISMETEDPGAAIEGLESLLSRQLRIIDDTKSIIFPDFYTVEEIPETGELLVYTVSDLGLDFTDFKPVSMAVETREFAMRSRLMAGLNLASIFAQLEKNYQKLIRSAGWNDIFVNQKNGDVKVFLEDFLEDGRGQFPDMGSSPQAMAGNEAAFYPDGMKHFLAYVLFRLLLADDPFDGAMTLTEYPLLTPDAVRMIHGPNAHYIFAKDRMNPCTEYVGSTAGRVWKGYPAFLRRSFERAFTIGLEEPDQRPGVGEWLLQMRRLRDCLVVVNNQVRLCDPEAKNSVLFLQTGEYMIPLWEKKAIYYYHVGLEADDPLVGNNGMIAGLLKDKYLLNNSSGLVWTVNRDGRELQMHPGEQTQLREGMFLTMPNGCTIRVVSTVQPQADTQADTKAATQAAIKTSVYTSPMTASQADPQPGFQTAPAQADPQDTDPQGADPQTNPQDDPQV